MKILMYLPGAKLEITMYSTLFFIAQRMFGTLTLLPPLLIKLFYKNLYLQLFDKCPLCVAGKFVTNACIINKKT